ncbi:THC0290_0291 family protein [Salinimicrobium sp. GXAS 041]|uniref:THC0290_0291 family protein n=1 Tax=Salinimicrobium sp. GXAS 041 TaxID=3400806 RepID=UPI003C71BD04
MTKFSFTFTLLCLLFFFGKGTANAQYGIGQEIGVVAGPVAFFSDYGERYSLEANSSNIGFGVGIVHYMNFAYSTDCNCYTTDSYFNDHFKLRSEIDFHYTELNHFGPVAEKQNENGKRLREMQGSTRVFEIGAHLEWYPYSIRDYTNFAYPIAPFVSFGGSFVSYKPDAYSTLGPLEENLFPTFKGGLDFDRGSTWSAALGVGIRYKLGRSSDLVAIGQWRYYHTDWLDGLNHDNPQNKAKDIIYWLNVGYIYYINF